MSETATRKFTIYLPGPLGRLADFSAKNAGGKSTETLLSDLVCACLEDLRDVETDGAEGVEKLLSLVQKANVEHCATAREIVLGIIERETFPAVAAARLETGIQPLKP